MNIRLVGSDATIDLNYEPDLSNLGNICSNIINADELELDPVRCVLSGDFDVDVNDVTLQNCDASDIKLHKSANFDKSIDYLVDKSCEVGIDLNTLNKDMVDVGKVVEHGHFLIFYISIKLFCIQSGKHELHFCFSANVIYEFDLCSNLFNDFNMSVDGEISKLRGFLIECLSSVCFGNLKAKISDVLPVIGLDFVDIGFDNVKLQGIEVR